MKNTQDDAVMFFREVVPCSVEQLREYRKLLDDLCFFYFFTQVNVEGADELFWERPTVNDPNAQFVTFPNLNGKLRSAACKMRNYLEAVISKIEADAGGRE